MSISFSSLLAIEAQCARSGGLDKEDFFYDRDARICFTPVFDALTGKHYAFASAGRIFLIDPCGFGQVSLKMCDPPLNILLLRHFANIPWAIPLARIKFGYDMVPVEYRFEQDKVHYFCDTISLPPAVELAECC